MPLIIQPFDHDFGAVVSGIDITTYINTIAPSATRSRNTHYYFFCDQSFDDDTQIASIQLFGPLENLTATRVGSGASSLIADISNVDRDNDETLLVDVPVMIYRSGNEMWLTDSSFQEIPTMAPMLSDARSKKAERT